MVLWMIGMSASGKTTIGKKLFERLKSSNEKWVLLDGDTFRSILGEDLGHTVQERRKNAYRISRFCEFLNSQNINVLACVLSIFHDNQKYNRDTIDDYKEVYIDVQFEKLVQRDNKELYRQALAGKIENVVGVDIEFKAPYAPDLILDNNSDDPDFDTMIAQVIECFDIQIDQSYSYTHNNLLEIPHKYQYSVFEGASFFQKLHADRQETIDFLCKRTDRLNQVSKAQHELSAIEDIYAEGNLVLQAFLSHLLHVNTPEALQQNRRITVLLIKRFEVSKKLYLTYDATEVRKSSLVFDNLLNYALFSLVLQNYFYLEITTEEKLMYFNAILKVNDILSSVKSDIFIANEIIFTLDAIRGESKIIDQFISDCL